MKDNNFEVFVLFAQSRLGATNVELARHLHVSTSTIVRWKTGKSRPHPLCETAVMAMLCNAIRDRDNELQEAIKISGWKPPYHFTGTDNPVDFPK